MYCREPIELSATDDKSSIRDNQSKAYSVLKLPETTLRLSHCEVYSLCLDEMAHQEIECLDEDKKAGRLMPGLPRRRRGLCNRMLVPAYQAVDLETKNLEESYGNCIKSRLGQSITEVEATSCGAHSLPPTLGSEPCRSKLHVIKNHCSKLARCCTDAEVCRKEVDRSEAARLLRRKKESLALAAAKCMYLNLRTVYWNCHLVVINVLGINGSH
ncbi:hypothetical protein ANCCAN_08385 [Ancylostoma caninum]|uniref:Uncharacterized protein n=1 Tax=Ancylostoma caninum TaxID=29170 RepID=A0A368GR68_ANCCA|nr:hypothetical protein ANCCAN_08385 [Ancylostoma caninum]